MAEHLEGASPDRNQAALRIHIGHFRSLFVQPKSYTLRLYRALLPAPAGPTIVAVKIIDMLGEEVLATATV